TTFYERALNPADSPGVRLAPGTDAGHINVVLTDSPRFTVKGRILPPIPSDLKLSFDPEGIDLNTDRDDSYSVGSNGAFSITGVSPGSYVMLASSSQFSS